MAIGTGRLDRRPLLAGVLAGTERKIKLVIGSDHAGFPLKIADPGATHQNPPLGAVALDLRAHQFGDVGEIHRVGAEAAAVFQTVPPGAEQLHHRVSTTT